MRGLKLFWLIPTAAIAVVGAFAVVKGIFGWPEGGFKDNLGLLLAGVGAVTLYLLFEEFLRYRRQQGVKALADKMSFRFTLEQRDEFSKRLGTLLTSAQDLALAPDDFDYSLENALRGSRDGVQVLVGDLETSVHGNEETHRFTQTIIYFTGPDLSFPKFEIRPGPQSQSLAERLNQTTTGNLPSLATGPSISFARSYGLTSTEMELVERLFSGELKQYLATRPGWMIRTESAAMLLGAGCQASPDQWEDLLNEALEILKQFNHALDQMIADQQSIN